MPWSSPTPPLMYTYEPTMLCRLSHPIMPYVTEELWQRLPQRSAMNDVASIMIASYPTEEADWFNPIAESQMEIVTTAISGGRYVDLLILS